MTTPKPLLRLRSFVQDFTRLVDERPAEPAILAHGSTLLARLVAQDDWLPEAFAAADPARYQQYLLHCDALERFSVISFVWGPGQRTPVHNHTVWGLVGMLRGQEVSQDFALLPQGGMAAGARQTLRPGEVAAVSPSIGDVHRVENALGDAVSVSIHVYGANIGAVRRAVFDPATGAQTPFVSGYAAAGLPNIWL